MKAPCLGCTERTVIPNCHGACERYKAFTSERELIREIKMQEHEANHLLVKGKQKIKKEKFRRKKG